MKNFVITQILPHGARFAQMSSNFKLNVCIKNDVVSLDFIDEESNQELFTTFFFIDYEGYKIKGTVLLVCCLFCCMIFDALQRLLHSLFL